MAGDTGAPEDGKAIFLQEVVLDYGPEAFVDNDAGIRLPKESLVALWDAAHQIKSRPSQTVVLEGHTPGKPHENNALRQSIGEEAADMCKEQLQEAGVENEMRCIGLGSAKGLGMRVRLVLLNSKTDSMSEDVAPASPTLANPKKIVRPAESPELPEADGKDDKSDAATDVQNEDDGQAQGLPQVLPDSETERREFLDHSLQETLKANPLSFVSNSSDLTGESQPTILRLSRLLQAFPDLAVQCSGFAKGRPEDNNAAKRQLSQARADSVRTALQQSSVTNVILSYGFGSVLGGGLVVAVNALPASEAEGISEKEFRLVPRQDSGEEASAVLNQLLKEVLLHFKAFEPNKAKPSVSPQLRMAAAALNAFPDWIIRCEGHAKGKPQENNLAKRQLSQVRAEGFGAALKELGVANIINCYGLGSEHGLGVAVRMFAIERQGDIKIPETTGMTSEEQSDLLDKLFEKALKGNVDFTPNKPDIPASAAGLIRTLAQILKAFSSDFVVRCEAHARGMPEEDSDSKRKLTKVRAESWCKLLKDQGVRNVFLLHGAGSSQGLGPCVRMRVVHPHEQMPDRLDIPDMAGLSEDERRKLANSLLSQALQKDGRVQFEANSYRVPSSAVPIIQTLARVLTAFPDFSFCCEGHSNGQSADDNYAKQRLSYLRAEAIKAAVKKAGAANGIQCVGRGCELGQGTGIRMFVIDAEELLKSEIQIPDTGGLAFEERARLLDELLAEASEGGMKFEPNTMDLQLTSTITVSKAARVLKAFQDTTVQCVGHAKGKPEDNNDAKVKLSQGRAEAVRKALVAEGVTNEVLCVGRGCSDGLGICVQLCRYQKGDP